MGVVDEAVIGERYRALAGEFDERRRRLWAAAEARAVGRGGIAAVTRATGIAENTIRRGLRELESGERLGLERVRRPGAGRRPLVDIDSTLVVDLALLVDEECRGDPESPLRWTAKSVRRLRDELRARGHEVSHETVAQLLRALGFSLQANRKMREGASHPDRDSSGTSTAPPKRRLTRISRWSLSTRKRRSWSAISRTADASGASRESLSWSAFTTSRTSSLARRSPTASTTSGQTRVGFRSGSIATRASSQSHRSKAGGSTSALT